MTIENVVYPTCSALLLLVFAYKARQLRPRAGGPRVWALYGTILFPAGALGFSSPASSTWMADQTGVANIVTPLVGAFTCAFIASALVMASYWRHSAARVRRIVLAYTAVVGVMVALFAASSVPENRVADFGIHYAGQWTVVVFHLVWHGSILAGAGVLARWLLGWAAHGDFRDLRWLRRGLVLYAATGLVLAGYALSKITAIGVTRLGVRALDPLDDAMPMITAVIGSVLLTGALVVPALSSRWLSLREWCTRCRALPVLRALHRRLQPVDPDLALFDPARRFDARHRVRRMLIELNDWRSALAPHFDRAVEETATRLGEEAGLTGERLAATVEAARLKAASNAWQARPETTASPAGEGPDLEERGPDDAGLDLELAWWISVARAFRTSRIVAEAVQ